jgi:NDP-sugar pyrophosphorylase family protein
MGSLTAHLPKPLLFLPGGTLLEHQLALLARSGVGHTFVVTRHRGVEVVEALRGFTGVTPLRQRPPSTLLGALATVGGHVTEPVLVLHGDNYFSQSVDYLAEAGRSIAEGGRLKAVFLVEDRDEQRSAAERLASTGCYILSPALFEVIGEISDGDELRSLTEALLESGVPVKGVPLRGWRANVNTVSDLLATSRRMLETWSCSFHADRADEGFNRRQTGSRTESPLWVSPDAETMGSRLGPFVTIGPGAIVEDCVLREAIVFPDAQMRRLQARGVVVLQGPDEPLVLAPQNEGDGGEKGHDQKEPP